MVDWALPIYLSIYLSIYWSVYPPTQRHYEKESASSAILRHCWVYPEMLPYCIVFAWPTILGFRWYSPETCTAAK